MKTIATSTTKLPSNEKAKFTHEQLHEALMVTQDALERALIPFFLLDETARQMMQELPTLSLDEISIGVKKNCWTDDCKSIFRMYIKDAEYTKVNVSFNIKEVPVIIWIIENTYSFLENPDTRWYYTGKFKIPNPFKLYWKSRFLIK